eukprot:TRINITY_DN109582_c0_g1_i1.p2 TRINITY_DN109582_c0_g1~~TRINITY_DN109582_c0_g1_i1.p2  ORF type:complete len:258 (+),score=60.70 TRINITY_DN109582_c0_g1_i1:40-774(+)
MAFVAPALTSVGVASSSVTRDCLVRSLQAQVDFLQKALQVAEDGEQRAAQERLQLELQLRAERRKASALEAKLAKECMRTAELELSLERKSYLCEDLAAHGRKFESHLAFAHTDVTVAHLIGPAGSKQGEGLCDISTCSPVSDCEEIAAPSFWTSGTCDGDLQRLFGSLEHPSRSDLSGACWSGSAHLGLARELEELGVQRQDDGRRRPGFEAARRQRERCRELAEQVQELQEELQGLTTPVRI